ncbi:MAG: FKBP-type peptidyl-prolyl cis-trans isomerase [Oscillospiraceae bacterium]|nr:FKBP-type peptidyl-prolyl cis-trans isomerase [Oscillospiraceae bacterium]
MKKIISLLLVALLCFACLTGCGKSDYVWLNPYGISFDLTELDYLFVNPGEVYDSKGNLKDIDVWEYITLPETILGVTLTADDINLSEEDLDAKVNDLLAQYAVSDEITDRAVEEGDLVNIDFVGSVDGEEFPGGNSEGMGYDVTAGSNEFIDDFLTQIIDHMPGETFDVEVTFPDGYGATTDADGNIMELAGRDAVFVVTINYIHGTEKTYPELTDEWVDATLGESDDIHTVEELRADMNDYFRTQNIYSEATNKIATAATYTEELPRELIDHIAACRLYSLAVNAAAYEVTLPVLLNWSGYPNIESYLDNNVEEILAEVKSMLLTQALVETLDVSLNSVEVMALLGTDYGEVITTYGEGYAYMAANAQTCFTKIADAAIVEGEE